jgi:hypothetical protein
MKPDRPPCAPAGNRAVSNTVAFVLVFSLIITSAGLVTTFGLGSLRDVQQSQQAEMSTGALRAIGGGIDEIAQGQRPAYSDSITLGGGQLLLGNETTVEVTVSNATGPVFDETYHPRTLVYEFEGRNTSYGSGVLASGADGQPGVLVSGPSTIRCSPAGDVAVVTVVELVPERNQGIGGGSVTVDARQISPSAPGNVSRLRYPTARPHPTATNLTVTVSGPWQAAWRDALVEKGFTREAGGTVSCDASTVTVRVVRVRIDLIA